MVKPVVLVFLVKYGVLIPAGRDLDVWFEDGYDLQIS